MQYTFLKQCDILHTKNIVFTTICHCVYDSQPNNHCIRFYGRGIFQKSKSISGAESHLTLGFLKTNKKSTDIINLLLYYI